MSTEMPVVGDAFPSVTAFQLTCHRAPLSQGIELYTATPLVMSCRLPSAAGVDTTSQLCAFSFVAVEMDHKIELVSAWTAHTCDGEQREKRRVEGEAWTRGRIAELEQANKSKKEDEGEGDHVLENLNRFPPSPSFILSPSYDRTAQTSDSSPPSLKLLQPHTHSDTPTILAQPNPPFLPPSPITVFPLFTSSACPPSPTSFSSPVSSATPDSATALPVLLASLLPSSSSASSRQDVLPGGRSPVDDLAATLLMEESSFAAFMELTRERLGEEDGREVEGDTFPSVAAFKLSCHRAALAGRFEMSSPTSDDHRATMRCRLNSSSTAWKIGSGSPCSLSFKAAKSTSTGLIEVLEGRYDHACDPKVRKKRREPAEAWTVGKIAELEGRERQEKKRAWESGSSEAADTDSDEDTEEEEMEEEASEAEESDDAVEAEVVLGRRGEDKPVKAQLYPSASELKDDIDALLSSGDVAFPSSTETFSSARQLLVRLHAYAHQRGFTFFRRSGASQHGAFTLWCWKRHHRYNDAVGGRCDVVVEAAQGSGGRWRVSTHSLQHNHGLVKQVDRRRKMHPRSALRRGPPVKKQKSPPPFHPCSSSPPPTRAFDGPLSKLASPPTPNTLDLTHLSAFLVSLLPPAYTHTVLPLTHLLAASGIRSTADLAALLLLDDSSVAVLEAALLARGVDAGSAAALGEVLRMAKQAYEA
ncbi:hypothetical protein JCM8097_005530 [Rhodosporidiobolus ruineniae]